MGLPLVLLGLGGLPWTALPCESHEPALVLGVLERCVVVFQNNLGEDAVFASSFPLGKEKKRGEKLSYFWTISRKQKADRLYFQTIK